MQREAEKQEEKWLICVDPDSRQIYTLNITTNDTHVEQDVPEFYRSKADQALEEIESMLKMKEGNWLMKSKQIDQYRRRKVPSYLLHKQSSSIPTYLCQSTLSHAFAEYHNIKLQVLLNEYADVLFKEDVMGTTQKEKDKRNVVEIEAGLVTGADEVIKSVLREIYQNFNQTKLQPKHEDNQFILQISGLKEYLTGNHPMLSYDRVRISLRGIKHLEVILTEQPKQQQSEFPPMISRRININEPLKAINWFQFHNVPILLWYSPVRLPRYDKPIDQKKTEPQSRMTQQINPIKNSQDGVELRGVQISIEKSPLKFNEISDLKIIQESGKKEEVKQVIEECKNSKVKEQINDLVSMKKQLAEQNLLDVEKNILYSGECDWPFSLRICSIENIIKSFEQDSKDLLKNRATYNGIIPPKYITKSGMKQEGEAHKAGQKEEQEQQSAKEVHLKLHRRTGRVLEKETNHTLNKEIKWIPFGGVDKLDELATLYELNGLDFLPYLISVQVSLYHGCKLLTSWSQSETKKQPFSSYPKFYQTITFPGIKISQLPQEARLCFNIVAHSASGQTQVIGSTTMYIFDDEKRFRSNMSSLNIWPFYKIDPRLLCMGQYWGLHGTEKERGLSLIAANLDYTRLLIQLDQFSEPMRWSLRDEKQMEELGYPKSAKCQRYFQMKNQYSTTVNENTQNPDQKTNLPSDSFGSYYSNTMQPTQSQVYGSGQQLNNQFMNNKKGRLPQMQIGGHQRMNTGPYDGYAQIGDQGTQMRFDQINQEKNNHFAPSVLHLQQGSSFNVMEASSSNASSFRLSNTFNATAASSNAANPDTYNQVYPYKNWSTTPRTEDLAILQGLLKYNPLNRPSFTEQHKYILMICRNHYKTLPYALQILLMAIEWDDPEQVREAHNMIKLWTPLPPEDALPLLDAPFADETVRLYAVERVSILSDDELQLYMLELTQCLMFEKHLFNPLAEMLLERSLQNPWVVGHELFWLLKAQLHVRPSYERYSLLLEQLLMLCGEFRRNLYNEVKVEEELNQVASLIKEKVGITKEQRNDLLRTKLQELSFVKAKQPFSFALDSRMEASSFAISECKVMDSKKLPLWLAVKPRGVIEDDDWEVEKKVDFDNNNPNVSIQIDELDHLNDNKSKVQLNQQQSKSNKPQKLIQIIFKNGDDIRQDMLTLQLIKIMDKIWLDAATDFRMKPYKTIATQDNVGMIEVVTNSLTIETLHTKAGVTGAFQQKTIWNHLKDKNTEPQSFETATENFLRSCAGYCVATFVLGIGDRHTGNIMLSDTGHLFHIDFGHFLGNFKSKFGIKRERTKFVLTQEMAFVMGGKDGEHFKKFQTDCAQAYNLVRKHGHFLINIFLMNLSAGMPELQHANNVRYLEEQLALNISDSEATAKFRQEIISSLNDTWRQIDNWFHYIKRK